MAAALGIVWSGVSEAKVCRLGDEGCETSEFFGTGDGQCDASYKPCLDPRAGATYCYGVYGGGDTPQALYRDEDCCSSLAANGYQECLINEGKAGYGLSCRGAVSNTTYWQYCGCSYGFVEVDESGLINGGIVEDLISGDLVPYESRCGEAGWGIGECQFAQCNEDRRFFYENGGEHCKYRLGTRCGGFGCMQVYDCNHDEEVIDTGKEYYRNENHFLADGVQNFIPFYGEDLVSNERLSDDVVKLILATSNRQVPPFVEGVHYEDYNVVNRYVCRYIKEDGNKTTHDVEDTGGGFSCNTVPNYCYLWDGCNEDRRWYNSGASTEPVNAGAIYNSDLYYQIWLNVVEKDADYHPENVHAGEIPQHLNFYRDGDVNPTYGLYEPIEGSIDGKNLSLCTLENGCIRDDKGCTYIRGDCHQDGVEYPSHRCWKKVSCTEENRFYASFMNAATISVDSDGNITGETNNLYESSLSEPYYTGFYGALEDPETEIYPACVYEINNCNDATGCYRKSLATGCIEDFEDVREHLTIEDDWTPWFEFLWPLCNDNTRCYKATSCDLSMGAYSSEPNTLFFQTISSTATGLTCYKGVDCYYEYGAYSSEPNTSFFSAINSHATSSICYRGESCHLEAGAYSSVPNLYFFKIDESIASGSTCYRGVECLGLDSGAYTSEPNTSFFNTIGSAASSSTCYRGTSCNIDAGAYSSIPNTLFFELSDSSASGSICYRGDSCYFEIGVYSSEPNTSFFENIDSLASGSTCYRGQNCNFDSGAYTSEPNTLFFDAISSIATGSTCYRGQGCDIEIGAYSSEPNTLFFKTISSLATGSTCYRGEACNVEMGAYTSEPNTSFFELIDSHATGSTCYRGDSCHIDAGAYSSTPNTLFFAVFSSTASGSTCYRGVECLDKDGGVYTSSPNTEFFNVIHSLASSSGCYRGESCNIEQGSYSSEPNTSFFEVINSSASGSICYRGKDCYIEAGAYGTTPNEEFFNVIESVATGLTCYRGEDCNLEKGSYSSEPNTVFFIAINSIASGSTCYRAEDCAETAISEELKNTSFFVFISSAATGSTCYRSTSCRFDVGAYSSTPNTSFFDVLNSMNALQDSTCYRGGGCNIKAGAYTSEPNTSFFTFITSLASGSTSYRVDGYCADCGAYTSTPNTSFFDVITSLGSGSIVYRAQGEHLAAGSYKSEPNTSFFMNISSIASGSVAYRSEESHIAAGAYSSSPNPLFFNVIVSHSSGSISYRADRASSDTIETNTSFFLGIHSLASGSIAYRSEKAHLAAGAYSSTPNTSFFYVISSYGSGSIAYRAENTHFAAGAYTSEPNTTFFNTIHSVASGSIAYRADKHCEDCGSYGTSPNTSFFLNIYSVASGSTSYRVIDQHIAAGAYKSEPNTSFFDVIKSLGTGIEAYRAQGAHLKAGAYSSAPNTSFFLNSTSEASGSTAYRGDAAHIKAGAYTSEPNLAFFIVDKSLASGSTCYRGAECAISAVSGERTNSSFFVYTQSAASGSTCYRSSACRLDIGAYSSAPNTSFFNVLTSTNAQNDSTCYRTDGCNIKAGAYSAAPNTSFFKYVTSEASGSISYRAEQHCADCGAYTSKPNTSFFIVISSHSSGSISYRAESSHLRAGAYTSSPNTLFFNVIKSVSSGSTSYRAESVDWLKGNYSSSPNTLFFSTIRSHASGSSAYRADTAKLLEGAYTSAPNTSFFIYSYSHASGIYAYRGDEIHLKAGAYTSAPNTMFFNTIRSLASGTISYRADGICKADVCGGGTPHVYTKEPNTSFFNVLESSASGSKAYRSDGPGIGAYSSSPNTSFFIVISSKASGSVAYRGEKSHIAAGAYSSTPNPLFFDIVISLASGSISYRAVEANFNRGAYTSKPNTSFFIGLSSHASGSTSYRTGPVNLQAGAYTSSPNTLFFYVINSKASGSIAYRGERVHIEAGAYTSAPNTMFFSTIKSLASGSTSYRASGQGGGGYSEKPNTSFFNLVDSKASGLTCYRGTSCRENVGTYTSTPNTSFFKVIKSTASGSACYRGQECATSAKTQKQMNEPFYISSISNREYYYTYFFGFVNSKASGSTCYRAKTYCPTVSAFANYTTAPNTSYFVNVSLKDTTLDGYTGTCYIADHCHTAAGAYSFKPNELFFVNSSAVASDVGCYRGNKCVNAAYDTTPNTLFFTVISSKASGSTCFRSTGCNTKVGAYTAKPNTMYFDVIESSASGKTCYRAKECSENAIDTKLSSSFFVTSFSNSSGTDCYRGDVCHQKAGAYTDAPNAYFFEVAESHSPTESCYRGTACSSTAAPSQNTSFFRKDTYQLSIASGSRCYRGKDCNAAAGAHTSEPDRLYFNTSKKTEGTTCYRATSCNKSEGAVTEAEHNTAYFNYTSKTASSSTCYRATSCNTAAGALTNANINTVFFKYSQLTHTGNTCYRVSSCSEKASDPKNTSYFTGSFDQSTQSGKTCYRGKECHIAAGAYTSKPNASFFNVGEKVEGTTCYRGTSCNSSAGAYKTSETEIYFNYISSTASKSTCYRATSCNEENSSPTEPYFDNVGDDGVDAFCGISTTIQTGIKCYYPTKCKEDPCSNPPCSAPDYSCGDVTDYRQYCNCCEAKLIHEELPGLNTTYSKAKEYYITKVTKEFAGKKCYGIAGCASGEEYPEGCDTKYFKPEYGPYCNVSCGNPQRKDECHLDEEEIGTYSHAKIYIWGNEKTCGYLTLKEAIGCNEANNSYPLGTVFDRVKNQYGQYYDFDEVFKAYSNISKCEGTAGKCLHLCSCRGDLGWSSSKVNGKPYIEVTTDQFSSGQLGNDTTTSSIIPTLSNTTPFGPTIREGMLVSEMTPIDVYANTTSLSSSKQLLASTEGKATCYKSVDCPDGYVFFGKGKDYYTQRAGTAHRWIWANTGDPVKDNYCAIKQCSSEYFVPEDDGSYDCSDIDGFSCCKERDEDKVCPDYFVFNFNYSLSLQMASENCFSPDINNCAEKLNNLTVTYSFAHPDASVNTNGISVEDSDDFLDVDAFGFMYNLRNTSTGAISETDSMPHHATCKNINYSGTQGICATDINSSTLTIYNVESTGGNYYTTTGCSGSGSICRTFDGFDGIIVKGKTYRDGSKIKIKLNNHYQGITKECEPTVRFNEPEKCPDGYFVDKPDGNYFSYDTKTLSDGTKCYKARCGGNYGLSSTESGQSLATYHDINCYCPSGTYYYSDPEEAYRGVDQFYFKEGRVPGCYEAACKYPQGRADLLFSGYGVVNCPGAPCYTGGGSMPADQMSKPSNADTYFDYDSVTHEYDGKTCYYNIDCNSDRGYTSTDTRIGCRTWGSKTCCQDCPTNSFYSETKPEDDTAHIFTNSVSGSNCWKIECNEENGYYLGGPNDVHSLGSSFGVDSVSCGKGGCPEGYYTTKPNLDYFVIIDQKEIGDYICYKADCASGYSSSAKNTPNSVGGTWHGHACYKEMETECPQYIKYFISYNRDTGTNLQGQYTKINNFSVRYEIDGDGDSITVKGPHQEFGIQASIEGWSNSTSLPYVLDCPLTSSTLNQCVDKSDETDYGLDESGSLDVCQYDGASICDCSSCVFTEITGIYINGNYIGENNGSNTTIISIDNGAGGKDCNVPVYYEINGDGGDLPEPEEECPAGYYEYTMDPDTRYFNVVDSGVTINGNKCLQVNGCQAGYVNAQAYTAKNLPLPSPVSGVSGPQGTWYCYNDVITVGYYFYCDGGFEGETDAALQQYNGTYNKLSSVSYINQQTCDFYYGVGGTSYPECNIAGWVGTLSGAVPVANDEIEINFDGYQAYTSQITGCGDTATLTTTYKCTYQTQNGESRYFCTMPGGTAIGGNDFANPFKDENSGVVPYCSQNGQTGSYTCELNRAGTNSLISSSTEVLSGLKLRYPANGLVADIPNSKITYLPLNYNTNTGNLRIHHLYYNGSSYVSAASTAFNKGSVVSCPSGSYYYGYASPLRDDSIYEYTEVGGNGSGCYKVACDETIELGVYSAAMDTTKSIASPLLTSPAAGETNPIYTTPLKTWDTIATANGIKCYLSPQPTHIVKYYEPYYSGSGTSSGDETCYNVVGVDFIRGGIERYNSYTGELFDTIEAEDVSDRFTIDSINSVGYGTTKCSGGYLDSGSTNYLFNHLRSNRSLESNYMSAVYTCDSQGRATACIDKFNDYRTNVFSGDTLNRTLLTPSIGNCHYSQYEFQNMSPYQQEEEYSFYHSKSSTIYAGRTLTLIEQNDYTRRNAIFNDDNGFVTVSLPTKETKTTAPGVPGNSVTIDTQPAEVRVPSGVSISDVHFTATYKVDCYANNSTSPTSSANITHTFNGTNTEVLGTHTCGTANGNAPYSAKVTLKGISIQSIPSGYGLRYQHKNKNIGSSVTYDDKTSGIITAPTGYGVATKSSNKWGGRCTSPLIYDVDIPVPDDDECPDGLYYYDEDPNDTYANDETNPYVYTQDDSNPNCYSISCGFVTHDFANYTVTRNLATVAPAIAGFNEPIKSKDTKANSVKQCYLSPEPTHWVLYYDTYKSGSYKCYEPVGTDYLLGESYFNGGRRGVYKDTIDVSRYYRITDVNSQNMMATEENCTDEMLKDNEFTAIDYYDSYPSSKLKTINSYLNCTGSGQNYEADACIYTVDEYQTDLNVFSNMTENHVGNCTKLNSIATELATSLVYGVTIKDTNGEVIKYNRITHPDDAAEDSDTDKTLFIISEEVYEDHHINIKSNDDEGFVTAQFGYEYNISGNNKTLELSNKATYFPDTNSETNTSFMFVMNVSKCMLDGSDNYSYVYKYENGTGYWTEKINGNVNRTEYGSSISKTFYTTKSWNSPKYESSAECAPTYYLTANGIGDYGFRWTMGSIKDSGILGGGVLKTPKSYGRVKQGDWGGRCEENKGTTSGIVAECPQGDIVFDRTDPDVDRLFYSETIDGRSYSPITDFYDLTRANSQLYCLSPTATCKTTLTTYDEWLDSEEWVGEFSEAIYDETGNENIIDIYDGLGVMADNNGYCVKSADNSCPDGYVSSQTSPAPSTQYFDVSYTSTANGTMCWKSDDCNNSNRYYAYSSSANLDCHEAYSSKGNLMKCCQQEYYLNCTYKVPETPSGQTYILTENINGMSGLYGEVSCSWLDGKFPISNYCNPLNRTLYIKDKEVHYGANPTSINTVNKNYKLYNDIIYQSTLNSTFVVGAGQVPLSTSSVSGVYVYDYIDNGSLYATAKIVNEGTLYACDSNGNNCKTSATTTCSGGETVTVNYNSNYVTPPDTETTGCDIGYTSTSSLILERAQWDVTKYTLSDGTTCAKASCKSDAISSTTLKTGYTCTMNPVTGTTPYCCMESTTEYPNSYEITIIQDCDTINDVCSVKVTGLNFVLDSGSMILPDDSTINPTTFDVYVSPYVNNIRHVSYSGTFNTLTEVYYKTNSLTGWSTCFDSLGQNECTRPSEITGCETALTNSTYIKAPDGSIDADNPLGKITFTINGVSKTVGIHELNVLCTVAGSGSSTLQPMN